MMRKLLIITVAVCFAELVKGDAFQDIVIELAPKLENVTAKVSQITLNGAIRLRNSYLIIEQVLDEFENQIDARRNKFDEALNQTVAEAQKSGKNISACVEAEEKEARYLNKFLFQLCRVSKKLNELTVKVEAVGPKAEDIVISPLRCARKAEKDADKYRQCIVDIVADAEKEAGDLDYAIYFDVPGAEEHAYECGKETVEQYNELAEKTEKDFVSCVKKA